MSRVLSLFTNILLLGLLLPGAPRASGRVVVSDLAGERVAPLERGGRRGTVLVFVTNDCPIANASAPEIERIYNEYAPKQIRLVLVYVDATLSLAEARAHHRAYRYTCPAVLDPNHLLVKAAHASVTPEAALFAPGGRLLYHGRIDDRAIAFGQVRARPTRQDLRVAMDALLQGKQIPATYIKAIGCGIADLGKTP